MEGLLPTKTTTSSSKQDKRLRSSASSSAVQSKPSVSSLLMAFFSCLAWLYVACRYQRGQVRAFGMLAGGSAITPMFQVTRAILEDPKDKTMVHLVYANVSYDDILLKEELDNLAYSYPNRFKIYYVQLIVAVKQLNLNGLQGTQEFMMEVLMLRMLHH